MTSGEDTVPMLEVSSSRSDDVEWQTAGKDNLRAYLIAC